jgi:hypothetical protein
MDIFDKAEKVLLESEDDLAKPLKRNSENNAQEYKNFLIAEQEFVEFLKQKSHLITGGSMLYLLMDNAGFIAALIGLEETSTLPGIAFKKGYEAGLKEKREREQKS